MISKLCIFIIIIITTCMIAGCQKEVTQPKSTPIPPGVILPEWAPENPSPEFLRAAKVLKPIPVEMEMDMLNKAGHKNPALVMKMSQQEYTPAWEFFGTLTDEQIEQFCESKRLHIRIKNLSSKQRAALDRLMEKHREVFESDLLVNLYKNGANEDLSNALIGIDNDGYMVDIRFLVLTKTNPDEELQADWFAIAVY